MRETFEDYLQRLKDRRTEDDYKYTDEDFIKYEEYIRDCCKNGMSVYKCLELMYFAEKDMDDQLFNREPKQETLEEAAKNYICKPQNNDYGDYNSFIEGAKWQQERSYSEEEVLEILASYADWSINDIREWFEQFKNK